MTFEHFIQRANKLGSSRTPFLFLVDFEQQKPLIIPLSDIEQNKVKYDITFQGQRLVNSVSDNTLQENTAPTVFKLTSEPIDFNQYADAFAQVQHELHKGNSYLLNLTFATPIWSNWDISQIFANTQAKYKLWLKDEFVCFSPECFVEILDNQIFTYPMKGTIDASLDNAEQQLLDSDKETREHYTIVDLLRNDLAMVATDISVSQFRYLETLNTHKGRILQTSSQIKGTLSKNWQAQIGTILSKLLPAGSICGAPKQKTVEIITQIEGQPRGYYSGVFGLFLGDRLTSAVAIRYIEQQGNQLYFRSGGGITTLSKIEEEYDELIKKIYVPIAE